MGKKREPWADEVSWATAICAPLGCSVVRSDANYEIAKVRGDGVSLVLYPHRTTAMNYHVRVRNNGSKDKAKAGRVMQALNRGEGLPEEIADQIRVSCTFSSHLKIRPPKHAA